MFETSTARNLLIGGVFAVAAALAGCGNGENGGTQTPDAGLNDRDFAEFGREGDIVLGDPDAPVSIIEYASPTCPHCAEFAIYVFPYLEEEYINTGKVRYVLRAMPTAPQGLAALAFMMGRCVEESRYYDFMDAIFRTQRQWLYMEDPQQRIANLRAIGRQAGISDEEFEVCRQDEAELQRVQDEAEEAVSMGITSTPSFLINGELQVGAVPWQQFEQLIIPHLPEDMRPAPEETESEDESATDSE